MVGGSVWRIRKDTEELVYAVDFNHRRDLLLEGSPLDSFSRPSLLITSRDSLVLSFCKCACVEVLGPVVILLSDVSGITQCMSSCYVVISASLSYV